LISCDSDLRVASRPLSSLRVVGDGTTLAVVGGGNMGSALVAGLLRSGAQPSGIVVCEIDAAKRRELELAFPGVAVVETIPSCDQAVIAVKPAVVEAACRSAVAAGAVRIVSIAAGVRIARLAEACGSSVRVIRAMPNTPALVGAAATAFVAGPGCTSADRKWAGDLLGSFGTVIEVDEPMLDAYTGLIGSGPAYLFYVAEALRDAAIAEGFDESTSAELVARLFVGTAALLEREPNRATALREQVTSPNGTTAAGMSVLIDRKMQQAFVAAVRAATERSKELGNS